MAKRSGTFVCKIGKASIGESTCSYSLKLPKSKFKSYDEAAEFLISSQHEAVIEPADDDAQTKIFPEDEPEKLVGMFTTKGIGISADGDTIRVTAAFNRNDVNVDLFAKYGERNVKMILKRVGEAPEPGADTKDMYPESEDEKEESEA